MGRLTSSCWLRPIMAAFPKLEPTSLETHLGAIKKRGRQLKKIQGWPDYGSFFKPGETMISDLIEQLSNAIDLEEYYIVLKRVEKALGNQLQEVYSRKASKKFFAMILGNSPAMPCPDPQLHYFIRLTFERVMSIYSEKVTERLNLSKPKVFPADLLTVYLHEIAIMEQNVAGLSSMTIMQQYLDQWGGNIWPQAMRASDIIPRSWSHCVSKMTQILDMEWKPAPPITVKMENGENILVPDDSRTLSSYVAHRAFFLALYLYCTIDPRFFGANFEAVASKVKESVLGDFLVEWVEKRAVQMRSLDISSKSSSQVDESVQSAN